MLSYANLNIYANLNSIKKSRRHISIAHARRSAHTHTRSLFKNLMDSINKQPTVKLNVKIILQLQIRFYLIKYILRLMIKYNQK